MKTFKIFLLSLILLLSISTGVKAEFFSDVIVTSANGIWTDSRAYATLNAAITAVGSNQRTVVIVGTQTVSTLTVPSNVTLKFERDGMITNTGQLTIQTKNIIADNRRIFTGPGNIDFASGTILQTGWFNNIESAFAVTTNDTVTLVVSKPQTITASYSPGNNVALKWEAPGNILTANAGVTVSNIGQVTAGNYQLFAGAGNFRFRDGTTLDLSWFSHLRSAITYINTNNVTLNITKASPVDYTDIVPENISVNVKRGGVLTIDGAVTLTINGEFSAGPYQVFIPTGTVVLSHVKEIYPEWYSSGSFTQATIEAALTAIGATNKATLLLRPGIWVISSNANWSAYTNVTWKLPAGATLQIATGKVLTIGGPFEAGLYQVFDCVGTGSVSFGIGSVSKVFPEWWQANTVPGTTVMTSAITHAINAAITSRSTLYFQGTRYFSGKWPDIVDASIHISAPDGETSIIVFDVDADNCITILPGTIHRQTTIENLRFHTANHVPSNIIFVGGSLSSDPQIFKLRLRHLSMRYDEVTSTYAYATGAFINLHSTSYALIDDCRIDTAYLGRAIQITHSSNYTPAAIFPVIQNTLISNIMKSAGYDGIGLQVDGCQGLLVRNSVIQGCRGGGVIVTQTNPPLNTANNVVFDGMHFEMNTDFDLKFVGTSPSYMTQITIKNSQFYYSGSISSIYLGPGRHVIEDCHFNNGVDLYNVSFNLIMRNCSGVVNTGAGSNYYTDTNRRLAVWAKTNTGSDSVTLFQLGGTGLKLFNITDKGSLQLLPSNGPVGTLTLDNAGPTTTVVNNSIVTADSLVYLFPTTANAANALATGVYISAKNSGVSFSVTHPTTPGASANFNYLIIN